MREFLLAVQGCAAVVPVSSVQETRKIKQAGLAPEKEQEVLQQLLHKETKLLQTIDRLKINANHENKDLRIQHTLTSMGKPKKFELKNGKTVRRSSRAASCTSV